MESKLAYCLDLADVTKWNMISATAASKASLVYMQEVGDFYAGPQYYTTREGFASYLIKITIDGCGILQYCGETYRVPAGKFYWVDCQKWHDYRTDPDYGSWHVMWVHFYGGNARFYYEAFLKNNNNEPVGTFPASARATSIMRSLLTVDGLSANQQEADFRTADLLIQLMTACLLSTSQYQEERNVPAHIEAIRQYLWHHYADKITLNDLGARFNINPQYMQKQFKRYIGQSPAEYLIYLRILKAKELMRTTSKSIGEIAYEVGVENLGYFTRLFKKLERQTPQQYRKMWPIMEGESGGVSFVSVQGAL